MFIPCLQEPTNGLYPGPDIQSTPFHPISLRSSLILSSSSEPLCTIS